MVVLLSLLFSFEYCGNGKHMGARKNTEGDDGRSPSGWGRWKQEIKDNRLGFLIVAIWMAMGIPVIYLALMFR